MFQYFISADVLPAYMSVCCVCAWCLQRQVEGVKFHGTGVTDYFKWPCG